MRHTVEQLRIALVLCAVLGPTTALAQFGPKKSPPPPPTTTQPKKPPPPPDTAKKPLPPPTASTPPPPPVPTPQELCEKAGGEWIDAACDMAKVEREAQRTACESRGDRWDESQGECLPAPRPCPKGQKRESDRCVDDCPVGQHYEEGKACVADAAPATLGPTLPPSCVGGYRWSAGEGCVADAGPIAPAAESDSGSPIRPFTIVVGSMLMGGGAVLGIATFVTKSSLDDTCTRKQCPPSSQDSWDTANTYANWSTGLFLVGGAMLALGLLIPDETEADQAGRAPAGMSVGLGPGQANASWVF